MSSTESASRGFWDDVLRLPLRILVAGTSVLILAQIFKWMVGASATLDGKWPALITGTLVLMVGVGLVLFLWWLTARFFRLIHDGKLNGSDMAAFKDLPMGLPEGTVRAILALVVAMVGLPLLLFHNVLSLDHSIAGYINGIVTGVFGFYFGTRTAGVPSQALDKITSAQQQAIQKTDEAAAAKERAATAESTAKEAMGEKERLESAAKAAAERVGNAASFDGKLSKLARHVALADTVIKVFGQALPPGVIPEGAKQVVADAGKMIAALQGVTGADATEGQLTELSKLSDTLTGSVSPIGALLRCAAPLFSNVMPVAGLGPVAGLVTVLGLGAKFGSSQYQRWRARVLAAPLGQGLVEFGAITPEVIHAALRQAPLLRGVLEGRPEADSVLANAIADPNGANRLLEDYGPQGKSAPGLIATFDDASDGLTELGQALLSLYSATDVQSAAVGQVADALSNAAHPELANSSVQNTLRSLSPSDANRLIDAARGLSARHDLPQEQRAAFDALVMLVDAARRQNVDLVAVLGELQQ